MRKKEKGHIRYNLQELRTVRVLHGALYGLKAQAQRHVMGYGDLKGISRCSQRNLKGVPEESQRDHKISRWALRCFLEDFILFSS